MQRSSYPLADGSFGTFLGSGGSSTSSYIRDLGATQTLRRHLGSGGITVFFQAGETFWDLGAIRMLSVLL